MHGYRALLVERVTSSSESSSEIFLAAARHSKCREISWGDVSRQTCEISEAHVSPLQSKFHR